MRIVLEGKPLSTGSLYRYACRGKIGMLYMTAKGKEMKESYRLQALSQWQNEPLSEEIYLDVVIHHGTKRKADIDNFHKIAFDSLNGIVWEDDSQIKELHVIKEYDKKSPRIELYIQPYEQQDEE